MMKNAEYLERIEKVFDTPDTIMKKGEIVRRVMKENEFDAGDSTVEVQIGNILNENPRFQKIKHGHYRLADVNKDNATAPADDSTQSPTIERLNKSIEVMRKQNDRIEELQAELDNLKDTIEEKDEEIKDLQIQIAEHQNEESYRDFDAEFERAERLCS